jgi:hypothetical protein
VTRHPAIIAETNDFIVFIPRYAILVFSQFVAKGPAVVRLANKAIEPDLAPEHERHPKPSISLATNRSIGIWPILLLA